MQLMLLDDLQEGYFSKQFDKVQMISEQKQTVNSVIRSISEITKIARSYTLGSFCIPQSNFMVKTSTSENVRIKWMKPNLQEVSI